MTTRRRHPRLTTLARLQPRSPLARPATTRRVRPAPRPLEPRSALLRAHVLADAAVVTGAGSVLSSVASVVTSVAGIVRPPGAKP